MRHAFTMKFRIETPMHLHAGGGDRVLADQAEREFELVFHNQHPYQLLFYEINNKHLQQQVEDEAIRASGEQTLEDQFVKYLTQRIEKEKERLGPGGSISHERFLELYTDAYRRVRQAQSAPGKNLNGEFTDFVEVRRPFIAPNAEAHTH
jgi:hypothetical protein